jgi:hypothetical protein
VEALQAKGYPHARGWHGKDEDQTCVLELDEGRLQRTVFVGANALQGVMYQWNLRLPHRVYHAPTIDAELAALAERFGLLSIRGTVAETGLMRPTKLGFLAPERFLTIYVKGRQRVGWSIGVGFDPQWGVLPHARVSAPSLLLDRDLTTAELGVSFPYREFLFQESAQWQWIHGHLALGYQMPLLGDLLSPFVRARGDSSVLRREDRGVRRVHEAEAQALIGVAVPLTNRLTLEASAGVDWIRAETLEATPEPVPNGFSSGETTRGVIDIELSNLFASDPVRLGLDTYVELRLRGAFASNRAWLLDSRLAAQVLWTFGAHDLLLGGRALWISGDVEIWDEEPLAGRFSRVFFDGRYWVRGAVQAQLNFRGSLSGDTVKLGVFLDASAFEDRSAGEPEVGLGVGGGPSLHFLLFDHIAADLYYAFGTDGAFVHNFAFQLGAAF